MVKLYKCGGNLQFNIFDIESLCVDRGVLLTDEKLSQNATIILSPTNRVYVAGGNERINKQIYYLDTFLEWRFKAKNPSFTTLQNLKTPRSNMGYTVI